MEKAKLWGKYLYHHDDYLGKHIQKNKEFYEIDFLKFSHEKLKNNTWIIIDIWANIWNHTVYRARKGHKVIAVEPSPDNIEILKINCWALENVATLWRAVSNVCVPIQIIEHESNRWEDTIKIVEESSARTHLTDEILELFDEGPVKLIKIDVEGMELNVLMWASAIIQRFLPDLMVEINNKTTMRYLKHLWYEVKYKRVNNKTVYLSHKIFND